MMQRSVVGRFHSRVVIKDGCWEWDGAHTTGGYGLIKTGRRDSPEYAHRLAWEFEHGVSPGPLNVLHSCDNPGCVNPAHLFLGTQRDNILDSVAKGRWGDRGRSGDRHWRRRKEDQT